MARTKTLPRKNKLALFLSATAVAAGGLLAMATPSNAAPAYPVTTPAYPVGR